MMRIDFDHLSVVIDEIYAGVSTPNGFKAALHRMRTVFSASRAALVTRLANCEFCYYEDRRDGEVTSSSVRSSRGALGESAPESRVALIGGSICSSCSARQHASRLCCCIDGSKGASVLPSIHLSLHREAGSPPFDNSERRALETLGLHVLRAVRLSDRIDVAETAFDMGSQVLDEVQRGVVVLNARKEVVFMNRSAEAICSKARGVTASRLPSGNRALRAISPAEDVVLQSAVDGALGLDSTKRRCEPSCGAVRIGGSPSGKPLLIRVVELPTTSGSQRRAVLFIDDLMVTALGDDRILITLFGLTKAEARTASALLSGDRPREIAARFSVSEDTVRTQLKAVYAKTETNGLSSLLALLTRLADVPVIDLSCASETEQMAPISVNGRNSSLAASGRIGSVIIRKVA